MDQKPTKSTQSFRCEECNLSFSTKQILTRHKLTNKHKRKVEGAQSTLYQCLPCNFQTIDKCRWIAHTETLKHLSRVPLQYSFDQPCGGLPFASLEGTEALAKCYPVNESGHTDWNKPCVKIEYDLESMVATGVTNLGCSKSEFYQRALEIEQHFLSMEK